jgi:uronate dehydrogenase
MRIAITGAEGIVGGVLRSGLSSCYEIRPLVRTAQAFESVSTDVADLRSVVSGFTGCDAVVHLAAAAGLEAGWSEILESNIVGTRNVYEAARMTGVKAVVFASSGHVIGVAEERAGPELYSIGDRRVFDEQTPAEPDSLYAVSKLYGETMGRYYSESFGLRVICLRLGTVLPDDDLSSANVGRGRSAHMNISERYPRLRAKWLSHRDCCQLFTRCIEAVSVRYAVVFGTSNNPRQIWSLQNARTLLGFEPTDSAPGELEFGRGLPRQTADSTTSADTWNMGQPRVPASAASRP